MSRGDDNYMPDQIAVRLITASGSEEEGWDIHWLTPCGAIDPVRKDEYGLHHTYYITVLREKLPWLRNFPCPLFIDWDDYNSYGRVIDRRDGKPILELIGENVG